VAHLIEIKKKRRSKGGKRNQTIVQSFSVCVCVCLGTNSVSGERALVCRVFEGVGSDGGVGVFFSFILQC
jgi:hypothetical protein